MAILFPVLFIAEKLPPWQCVLASLQTTTQQKHASNHHHAHKCTIIMALPMVLTIIHRQHETSISLWNTRQLVISGSVHCFFQLVHISFKIYFKVLELL